MTSNFTTNGPLKVGIGGPVGAGKTSLTAALCSKLKDRLSVAVITNDIYTTEDADFLALGSAVFGSCGRLIGGLKFRTVGGSL